MKILEYDINIDTKTICLADELFNESNKYTGVAFRSERDYFTRIGLIKLVIIAGFKMNQDYYWDDFSDYCTMTELKMFLCKGAYGLDVEKNSSSLGWINEIERYFSHSNLINKTDVNVYKRFSRKYQLHIQSSKEYQSYGHDWNVLDLEGFLFVLTEGWN